MKQPSDTHTDLPLTGVTVADFGQVYNGSYATFLMAMAGARVIKIESPSGEPLRQRGRKDGAGIPFAMINTNKENLSLNLKTGSGLRVAKEIIDKSDVLVENFRPGVMKSFGLGPDGLLTDNPRLVYASSSGYGSQAGDRQRAAMDLTIQAYSGVMATTGFPNGPPVKAGPAVADFLASAHLFGAVVSALYRRSQSGEGQYVEVSMIDAVYPSLLSGLGLELAGTGEHSTRTGNRHSGMAEAPYNVYEASNGYVAIICLTPAHWENLLTVMGREDLSARVDLSTGVGRVANMSEVDSLIEDWTRLHTVDEIDERLVEAGVPSAPVRELAEVVDDESMVNSGMVIKVEHPEFGEIKLPTSPIKFGGFRRREPIVPSRRLGEDSYSVLSDFLGYDSSEIALLVDEGAIRTAD